MDKKCFFEPGSSIELELYLRRTLVRSDYKLSFTVAKIEAKDVRQFFLSCYTNNILMIDKSWLNNFSGVRIEQYSNEFLDCSKETRGISICISTFFDNTNDTNIIFKENGIPLANLWIDKIDLEFTKKLFIQWLIEKIHITDLNQIDNSIEIEEIYNYYLKGESAMIEYRWNDIKKGLKQPHKDFSEKKVEILDLCLSSVMLKNYIPYLSVGRLCLSNTTVYQPHFNCWLCFNFIVGLYEVATYDHMDVHLFGTAGEAIQYVENNAIPILKY